MAIELGGSAYSSPHRTDCVLFFVHLNSHEGRGSFVCPPSVIGPVRILPPQERRRPEEFSFFITAQDFDRSFLVPRYRGNDFCVQFSALGA